MVSEFWFSGFKNPFIKTPLKLYISLRICVYLNLWRNLWLAYFFITFLNTSYSPKFYFLGQDIYQNQFIIKFNQ